MKPYIVTYAQVLEMKSAVAEHFSDKVHFHDACGGQYFNFDAVNPQLKDFIINYYSSQGIEAVFSDDEINFTLMKFPLENKDEAK